MTYHKYMNLIRLDLAIVLSDQGFSLAAEIGILNLTFRIHQTAEVRRQTLQHTRLVGSVG